MWRARKRPFRGHWVPESAEGWPSLPLADWVPSVCRLGGQLTCMSLAQPCRQAWAWDSSRSWIMVEPVPEHGKKDTCAQVGRTHGEMASLPECSLGRKLWDLLEKSLINVSRYQIGQSSTVLVLAIFERPPAATICSLSRPEWHGLRDWLHSPLRHTW